MCLTDKTWNPRHFLLCFRQIVRPARDAGLLSPWHFFWLSYLKGFSLAPSLNPAAVVDRKVERQQSLRREAVVPVHLPVPVLVAADLTILFTRTPGLRQSLRREAVVPVLFRVPVLVVGSRIGRRSHHSVQKFGVFPAFPALFSPLCSTCTWRWTAFPVHVQVEQSDENRAGNAGKSQIRRDKATIVGSSSIITLLLLLIIIIINNFIKAVPNERTEIIIMFE